MKKTNFYLKLALLLFLGLIIVIVFSKFVPFSMDEFSMYRVLMCRHYEYNSLNTFQESCNVFDLNVLNTGLILPLNGYQHYLGSFPSLYYYPLFLIWKNPISARLLGMIFLIIGALILSKIFEIRIEYIFLGLISFFPYFFQHMVDTGTVAFQIMSFFLIYYLLIKWFKSLKIIYPILISFIIFLGIWTKLTYFWFLPGIGIILIMHLVENRKQILQKPNLRKLIIHSLISAILLLGLLSLLFLSTDPNNSDRKPFLNKIKHSNSRSSEQLFSSKILETKIVKSFLNPCWTTERVYKVTKPSSFVYLYSGFIYLSVPLLWLISFIRLRNTRNKNLKKGLLKSILLFFVFIVTALIIISTRTSDATHHAIISFPFLILSFLLAINCLRETENHNRIFTSKRIILFWFLLFILFNSYFFISFHNQDIKGRTDFSKVEVNEILKNEYLAKNYFYVIVDWGMYYYQALYGNKFQSVLYMGLRENWDTKLNNLSEKHNRKLLFLHRSRGPDSSKIALIKEHFSVEPCNLIEEPGRAIWRIYLEPDNSSKNICFEKNTT